MYRTAGMSFRVTVQSFKPYTHARSEISLFQRHQAEADLSEPGIDQLQHSTEDLKVSKNALLSRQDAVQQNVGQGPESQVFVLAKHVRHACQGREEELAGLTKSNNSYQQISVDWQRRSMFCPIFKTSSTYLRRLFYTLDANGRLRNPYSITIDQALHVKTNSLIELLPLNGPKAQEFFSDVTSFLFVREPLARLLSGYVDKLFAPNPFYWNKTGTYMVSKYRPYATPMEKVCGHDLTFSEFVQYIVDGELDPEAKDYRDPHFTPAYDQCKVCHLNYTLVGKMEAFNTDMFDILKLLNIDITREQLTEWKKDVVKDAIIDSVESPFGWRAKVRMCISWQSALRRVWRKLQSRAIIPLEEKFPFSEHQIERLTAQDFIIAAHYTHLRANKARLKRQKKEILAMAYNTIDRTPWLPLGWSLKVSSTESLSI
ncbi:hypothetical protein RRG08_017425 [Elysia crispata]|uniref:Carbohydrate sulfotransferase n=1 Tax=Elysia crispata TaxID=231223 RepID=A0AAE1E9V0_9GAST|nr:hypothetical protein RRG08_017425 [Elysia crispata]